ncbi:MAG TPA: glycerol-3-phosphate 1-O-acyltransferase PlsY [Vicinamibacteria bacterium]|jgi:glycerol-3-phosphate acyltransferase PlsY|nr:glycerol-3-phosphate 1-O-acyltransferase PlsY [Vicinamibacteria bacterium]
MRGALILCASYLLGAIPFSFLVARHFGVADVRKAGSGNVGATNVMRTAGTRAGSLAFLLDAGKGAAAALLARVLDSGDLLPALAAAAAVLGHMFPIWLRFRGGKGVATGVGAFFPLAPLAAGLALATFAVALLATRYVSVASLCGTLALVVGAFLFSSQPVALAALACAVLIVLKHRANLERLIRGTEGRMRTKRS